MTEQEYDKLLAQARQLCLNDGLNPTERTIPLTPVCAGCQRTIDTTAGELVWTSTTAIGEEGHTIQGVIVVCHCIDY